MFEQKKKRFHKWKGLIHKTSIKWDIWDLLQMKYKEKL